MKKYLYLTALLLCSYHEKIMPAENQESDVIKFILQKGDDIIAASKDDAGNQIPVTAFKVQVAFKKLFEKSATPADITTIVKYLNEKAEGKNPSLPVSITPIVMPKPIDPKKEIKLSLPDQFLKNESNKLVKKFIENDISTITEDEINRPYVLFLSMEKASKEYDITKNYVIKKLQELLNIKLQELGKEPGKIATQDQNSYFNFDITDKKNDLYPAYAYLNTKGTNIINTFIKKGISQVTEADIDREFFEFCKEATKRPVRPEDTDFKTWKKFVVQQLQEMLKLKTAEQKGPKLPTANPVQPKLSDSFDFKVNGTDITLKNSNEQNYRAKFFLNQSGKNLVTKFIEQKKPIADLKEFVAKAPVYNQFLRYIEIQGAPYDDDSSEENNDLDFIVAQITIRVLSEQSKKPLLPPTQKPTPTKTENPLEDMDIATIISKLESGQLTPKRAAEALKKLQAGIDSADKAAKKTTQAQDVFKKELDDKIAALQSKHELSLHELISLHKAEKDAFEKQLQQLQQEIAQSKSSPQEQQTAEKIIQRAEISIGTDPIIEMITEAVVHEKTTQQITTAMSDATTQMTDLISSDELAQQVITGMLTPQQAAHMLTKQENEIKEIMIKRIQDLRAQYDLRLEDQERIHRLALEVQEKSYRKHMDKLSAAISDSKASSQEQQGALKDLAEFKESISSELFIQICKQHAEQLARALLKTGTVQATQDVLLKTIAQENITLSGLDDPNNMAYLLGYIQMKMWMLQSEGFVTPDKSTQVTANIWPVIDVVNFAQQAQ